MIRLDIEGYCQDCPAFEPVANRNIAHGLDDYCFIDIRVACENKDRCRAIHAYLKEETKGEPR